MEEQLKPKIMEIEQREHEGKLILKLSGKLDTNTSPEAETVFNKVLADGYHKILVNFQNLDYMSSAGLRVLLGTAKQLQGKGTVALCNMNDDVREVLEMTGLADLIFKIYPSEKEGLNNL
jgi:anti-sigma B factor antagonist